VKKIPFWKMSGSGNDFVVVDNRRKRLRSSLPALAAKLCHRQFGVGADGLLLLEPSAKADFRMVYFNADGSRASMCGNGARCMAWVAHEKGIVNGAFHFETDAGLVKGEVDKKMIKITLGDAFDYRPQVALKIGGKPYHVAYLNTGVPHVVLEVSNVDKIDLPVLGRAIRYHKAFGPKGANVNFIQRLNSRTIKVRTYERGVEGETLACGTGVTASAIVAALRGRVSTPVRCRVAGGDTLEVEFDLRPENRRHPVTNVTLEGPVQRTFVGEARI
jgi:diaminopimelate epimerase